MSKISSEVAQNELDRFIEMLKINPIKLKNLSEETDRFLDLVEYGALTINDEGEATLKLYDSFEFGEENIDSVKFPKKRITVKDTEKRSIGKTDMARSLSLYAFLAEKPTEFMRRMSADDFNNFTCIAAFFLPR